VSLFDPNDKFRLPIFKMELTFDEGKMEFYPSLQVKVFAYFAIATLID